MKISIICCVLIGASSWLRAQSPAPAKNEIPVLLQFPNSSIYDVLWMYRALSKRKVLVELGLTGKVTIYIQEPIPRAEAIALIRDTLRKDNGIEIREVGDSEAFVTKVTRGSPTPKDPP